MGDLDAELLDRLYSFLQADNDYRVLLIDEFKIALDTASPTSRHVRYSMFALRSVDNA